MTYIVARCNALSMLRGKPPQLSSSLIRSAASVKARCHAFSTPCNANLQPRPLAARQCFATACRLGRAANRLFHPAGDSRRLRIISHSPRRVAGTFLSSLPPAVVQAGEPLV